MKTRGQFSKPAPFNYQSHQSLQKFRKAPIEQRADQIVQDIFKVKIKGQQNSKFVAARYSAPTKEDEVKQLKKHIRVLQTQLKKKILDNPLLSRIFKTKVPSNGELSHIDLYIEFLNLKEDQQSSQKKVQQAIEVYKKKQIAYELQISQLKQQKQHKQQSFIGEIQKATKKFQLLQNQYKKKITEKQKLFEQQTIERQSKIQDQNLIMEQLKRKNHKLTKDIKDLEVRFNEYKKNEQQRIKNLKNEFQSYKHKVDEQKLNKNQQILKQKQSLNSAHEQLQYRIQSLENELAQKTLQIQQLDRFIELEKQSFENQMHQLESNYQKNLQQEKTKHEDALILVKQRNESVMGRLRKQCDEKIKQASEKYEGQIKKFKEESKQGNSLIAQLRSQIVQKTTHIKGIEQEVAKYKIQQQGEIQNLKSINKQISQDKQSLIKRLTQSEIKLQKLQKEFNFLSHQKSEIHSKYEKGYMNSEHDMKHYQTVIEQLQRKIYMLGNQNLGLRRANEERNELEVRVKELKRVNEEVIQERYKALGRVQQIIHKLQSYLTTDMGRNSFTPITTTTTTYRSTPLITTPTTTLIQSLQPLTSSIDKLYQNYTTLSQWFQCLRKFRIQDQRQIQSILNHFLDMQMRQQQLQDSMVNYINVRKELNKQLTAGQQQQLTTGEQYLHQNKRQLSHILIQKLIQLKVIKQYSSVDQINNHNNTHYNNHHHTKQLGYSQQQQQQQQQHHQQQMSSQFNNTCSSLTKYQPTINRNATKSVSKFLLEQNYSSTPHQMITYQHHNHQYDSLQAYPRDSINRQSFDSDKRISLCNTKEPLFKSKNTQIQKQSNRLSTEPTKSEVDIQQQSTYQIMDQNIDYGNLRKRQNSKFKLTQQYNSGGSAQSNYVQRDQLNKKYKQQIKEKLLQGKTKRQNNFGLSKQDIQKKYFLR